MVHKRAPADSGEAQAAPVLASAPSPLLVARQDAVGIAGHDLGLARDQVRGIEPGLAQLVEPRGGGGGGLRAGSAAGSPLSWFKVGHLPINDEWTRLPLLSAVRGWRAYVHGTPNRRCSSGAWSMPWAFATGCMTGACPVVQTLSSLRVARRYSFTVVSGIDIPILCVSWPGCQSRGWISGSRNYRATANETFGINPNWKHLGGDFWLSGNVRCAIGNICRTSCARFLAMERVNEGHRIVCWCWRIGDGTRSGWL